MRVGVFGGTFDPVHTGHLILAEQAREQARLDAVWFVPAAHPPHKPDVELTRFEQRVEMLRLAVAGSAAFAIDEVEKDLPGPNYTADTLAELARRHPEHEFFLLLGSDALRDLPGWHDPARFLDRTTLVVMVRPGHPVPPVAKLREGAKLPRNVPLRVVELEVPLIDISSRDLRHRAAAGRSLRYFMPRAVECYILEKGLYRPAGK
jgi:nicotinate-nucleotide adenylyltransferase